MSIRLPKKFFENRITNLKVRLNGLAHYLDKTTDEQKKTLIEQEMLKTKETIKQAELDSCFARID